MFVTSVNAEESNDNILNPDTVLDEAYKALIDGDTKKYADYVFDERFKTKDEALLLYQENHDLDPIIDFEIISKNKRDTKIEYFVKTESKSGLVEEFPVILAKDEKGNWFIYISSISIPPEDFKSYHKNPIDSIYKPIDDPGVIKPAEITLYNFTAEVSTHVYSKEQFHAVGNGLILYVRNQIAWTNPAQGGLKYELVKSKTSGDKVYATRTVYGNVQSGKYALSLGTYDGTSRYFYLKITSTQGRGYNTSGSIMY